MKDVALNVNASLSMALYGGAGVGKSSCAMKMATDYLRNGKDVVWINTDMHEENLIRLIEENQFGILGEPPGKIHVYTVDVSDLTIDYVKNILIEMTDYVGNTGASIGLIVVDRVERNNNEVVEILKAKYHDTETSLLFTKNYSTRDEAIRVSYICDCLYKINSNGTGDIKYDKYTMKILKSRWADLGVFTQVGPEKLDVKTNEGGTIKVLLYPKKD